MKQSSGGGGRGVPKSAGRKGKRHGGMYYANAIRHAAERKLKRAGKRAYAFANRRARGLPTSDQKRAAWRAEARKGHGDKPLPTLDRGAPEVAQ
jgi:hypothetical protein